MGEAFEPGTKTVKEVKAEGLLIMVLKGKNVVVPKTEVPNVDSGMTVSGWLKTEVESSTAWGGEGMEKLSIRTCQCPEFMFDKLGLVQQRGAYLREYIP